MPNDGSLSGLIGRYRTRGVLVDSNLLVGFVIGAMDRRLLKSCRALLKAFTPEDFDLLVDTLGAFDLIVTTPHVLTEVSNLGGKLDRQLHGRFREALSKLILSRLREETAEARLIVANPSFPAFGLTDTAIQVLAPGKYLVLTDELALAGILQRRGVDVLNFNHLRMASLT